jgi:TRAP-type C4-dicarboxylate transport system permease small subunit
MVDELPLVQDGSQMDGSRSAESQLLGGEIVTDNRIYLLVDRIIKGLTTAVTALTGVLLVAMMVLTVSDVARRELNNRSITGALEWTEIMLVAIAFGGVAAAEASRVHVRTDVLMSAIPAKFSHYLRLLGMALTLLVVGFLAYLTAELALDSFNRGEVRMGLARVPVWPARVAIALGFGVFFLRLLVDTFGMIVNPRQTEEAIAAGLEEAKLKEVI